MNVSGCLTHHRFFMAEHLLAVGKRLSRAKSLSNCSMSEGVKYLSTTRTVVFYPTFRLVGVTEPSRDLLTP